MKLQPVRAPNADPCRYLPPSRACRESSGFVDTPSFFVPTVNISLCEALVRFESSRYGVLPQIIISLCLPCAIGVLPSQGTVPPLGKCMTFFSCNYIFPSVGPRRLSLWFIAIRHPCGTSVPNSSHYWFVCCTTCVRRCPYIRFFGDPRFRKHPILRDLN